MRRLSAIPVDISALGLIESFANIQRSVSVSRNVRKISQFLSKTVLPTGRHCSASIGALGFALAAWSASAIPHIVPDHSWAGEASWTRTPLTGTPVTDHDDESDADSGSAGAAIPSPLDGEGFLLVKRTYQPNVRKGRRKHGYLARMSSPGGRKVLTRRRRKGRWNVIPKPSK